MNGLMGSFPYSELFSEVLNGCRVGGDDILFAKSALILPNLTFGLIQAVNQDVYMFQSAETEQTIC